MIQSDGELKTGLRVRTSPGHTSTSTTRRQAKIDHASGFFLKKMQQKAINQLFINNPGCKNTSIAPVNIAMLMTHVAVMASVLGAHSGLGEVSVVPWGPNSVRNLCPPDLHCSTTLEKNQCNVAVLWAMRALLRLTRQHSSSYCFFCTRTHTYTHVHTLRTSQNVYGYAHSKLHSPVKYTD